MGAMGGEGDGAGSTRVEAGGTTVEEGGSVRMLRLIP